MGNLFSKNAINRERQVELDVAKGIAIVFMIWVHVKEYYMSMSYESGIYNSVCEFLGSPPAAPVFMILLGMCIHYARHNDAKSLAMRGVKILVIAYVLNFIRDTVPLYIEYCLEGDPSVRAESLFDLVGVDILQFAGLAFLFFAFVKKFKLSNKAIFAIWCLFCTINMFLSDFTPENTALSLICGMFWQTNDYSWFPFLTWISYPIAGYILGDYLIKCNNKRTFYKNMALITGAVSVPLWVYSYLNNVKFGAFGDYWQYDYYGHDIMGCLVLITFAMFWISICYFITPYIPLTVKNMLTRWSKNINRLFCISYVFLGWGLLVLEGEIYSPSYVTILAVIFFALTDATCLIYEKLLSSLKKSNNLEEV